MTTRIQRTPIAAAFLTGALGASIAEQVIADPPRSIESVAAWGGAVNTFEKHGDIGYVGSGMRFVVLDLSDLTDINEVGSVWLGSTVRSLKVRGELAYVATSALGITWSYYSVDAEPHVSGLHVINVADPANPQLIWSIQNNTPDGNLLSMDDGETDLRLHNDWGFYQSSGIGNPWHYVVDLRIPDQPVLPLPVANQIHLDLQNQFGVFVMPYDMEFVGDLAYMTTTGHTHQLNVYDFSAVPPGVFPLEPQLLGSVNFFVGRHARWIDVYGQHAYVAVNDTFPPAPGVEPPYDTIWVVDVSDPANPIKKGNFSDFTNPTDAFRLLGQCVADGRLYVATTYDGLMIFDIASKPGELILIGSHQTGAPVRGVHVEGGIAYLRDRENGLTVLDVSDPGAVATLGGYYSPAQFGKVVRKGNLLYVHDPYGVSILNISNPASPKLLGAYRAPEGPSNGSFDVDDDGFLYLSTGTYGIEVIDVSNPATPVQVAVWPFSGSTSASGDMIVDVLPEPIGKVLYASISGLSTFDINDPTSPTPISSGSFLTDVTKFQRYAPGRFYASGLGAARDIDGTSPSNLVVQSLAGPSGPKGIGYDAARNLLYLGSGSIDGTLSIVNLESSPPGGVLSSLQFDGFSPGDTASHAFGALVLGWLPEAVHNRIWLLDVSSPESPSVMASARVGFPTAGGGGSTTIKSYILSSDRELFITSRALCINLLHIRPL